MSYVKHILLPGELVLYDGRVHPTVLLPGAAYLGIAAAILTCTGNTGGAYSLLLGFTSFLGEYLHFMRGIYIKLAQWASVSPSIDLDLKVLATGLALYGFSKLSTALLLIQTTELIVTDQRIIAKVGVFTVTTTEMDRRRIAGVTIYQTVTGRLLGYGTVFIQGFTSHIAGLPPIVHPHLLEKFVG